MNAPTIQDALSELLSALGFAAMANAAKTEQDPERIRRYARVIVRNMVQNSNPKAGEVANRFRLLNLI